MGASSDTWKQLRYEEEEGLLWGETLVLQVFLEVVLFGRTGVEVLFALLGKWPL